LYTYNSYTINLQTYPKVALTGVLSGNTTNGVYTFNNLQVGSFDVFKFLAYVCGYVSISDSIIISPYAYINVSDFVWFI
jgi:hypothetical protein